MSARRPPRNPCSSTGRFPSGAPPSAARLTPGRGAIEAAFYSSLLAFRSSAAIESGSGLGFLSLTPGPPPFSAMNSTPADARARWIAAMAPWHRLRRHELDHAGRTGRTGLAAS
jgi:hypothetical protein